MADELRIWSDAKSAGHPTKGGDMLGMTALRLERREAGDLYRVYAYDRIGDLNDGKPIGLVGHQIEGGWIGLTRDEFVGVVHGDTPYATPDEAAQKLYGIYMDRWNSAER